MAEQRCKEMVDEQGRTLGPEHVGSFRFSNCGAEIVIGGGCRKCRHEYEVHLSRGCYRCLLSDMDHPYDGYVCTNGHLQEAPSD